MCASACFFAFLGGETRLAQSGSLGVHRSSFSGPIDGNEAAALIQRATVDMSRYIRQMGADPTILELAYSYDSSDMRYLSTSEMEHYGVITGGQTAETLPQTAMRQPFVWPNVKSPNPILPIAQSGQIRSPRGYAPLKAAESQDSRTIAKFPNGSQVKVLVIGPRWYKVEIGKHIGYLHQNWVRIDQFLSVKSGRWYIQIASLSTSMDAEKFAQYAALPVAVYLASNGMYVVALADTFDRKHGAELVEQLKQQKLIPNDSYLTLGNMYAAAIR